MSEAKPKTILIAGDDGALYHLSEDDLAAHRVDPSHPDHDSLKRLVDDKPAGILSADTLSENTTINCGINTHYANFNKTKE